MDGEKWKVAGMHESVEEFDSYEALLSKCEELERNQLADKVTINSARNIQDDSTFLTKVRIWLLVIPLSGIPPRLIATMPLRSKVTRPELRLWHDAVEAKLAAHDLHHTTYNVDGATIERGLTHDLHNEAVAAGRTQKWTYLHPKDGETPLLLQAPVLANGKPRLIGTDGKHLKKNGRGSATSGARVITMGRYILHYGQLAELAESPNSPLLRSDIIGVDKQDDRACARLFSAAVIEQTRNHQTLQHEIAVILFLWYLGETVDGQQSRTLGHDERLRMLWRAKFFFEGWCKYVLDHPHYSVNTHFITRELYDIITIFVDAMITMILVHRDFFPDIPLLLWMSSTEVCEHFFGCARKIQKDFTFVEWILMVPKLTLLMMGEMKTKGTQTKSSEHRSGYHHFWHNSKNADYVNLTTYPTDATVQACINVAWKEAMSSLSILGIENPTSGSVEELAPQLAETLTQFQADNISSPATSEDEVPLHQVEQEPASLTALLAVDESDGEADDRAGSKLSRSNEVDQTMTNLGIAAAAVTIYDNLRM